MSLSETQVLFALALALLPAVLAVRLGLTLYK